MNTQLDLFAPPPKIVPTVPPEGNGTWRTYLNLFYTLKYVERKVRGQKRVTIEAREGNTLHVAMIEGENEQWTVSKPVPGLTTPATLDTVGDAVMMWLESITPVVTGEITNPQHFAKMPHNASC